MKLKNLHAVVFLLYVTWNSLKVLSQYIESSPSAILDKKSFEEDQTLRRSPRLLLVYSHDNCVVNESDFNEFEIKEPEASEYRSAFGYSHEYQEKNIEGTDKNYVKYATRSAALTELNTRLNTVVTRKLEVLKKRQLNHLDTDENSLKLETRYLSALHMEIANFPSLLKEREAIWLSQDLPCVQFISEDYKIYSDNQTCEKINLRILKEDELVENWAQNQGSSFGSLRRTQNIFHSQPNDPLYPKQWYLKSTPGGIGFDHVWERWRNVQSKNSVIIAISDDGCDITNHDLKNQLWHNPHEICGDGIDNDHNGYVDDCNGWDWVENDRWPVSSLNHGTAVSGIIAAEANNDYGIAGICWTCRIMCLRYIGPNGGSVSHQIEALDYAIRMGSKISNNSFGSYKLAGKCLSHAKCLDLQI